MLRYLNFILILDFSVAIMNRISNEMQLQTRCVVRRILDLNRPLQNSLQYFYSEVWNDIIWMANQIVWNVIFKDEHFIFAYGFQCNCFSATWKTIEEKNTCKKIKWKFESKCLTQHFTIQNSSEKKCMHNITNRNENCSFNCLIEEKKRAAKGKDERKKLECTE